MTADSKKRSSYTDDFKRDAGLSITLNLGSFAFEELKSDTRLNGQPGPGTMGW
jgi:hypothetical protein